jgi:hypothetical protein
VAEPNKKIAADDSADRTNHSDSRIRLPPPSMQATRHSAPLAARHYPLKRPAKV